MKQYPLYLLVSIKIIMAYQSSELRTQKTIYSTFNLIINQVIVYNFGINILIIGQGDTC